jgi:putative oxidoreductase
MCDWLFKLSPVWNNSLILLRVWCGVIFIRYGIVIIQAGSIQSFAVDLEQAQFPFPLVCAYLSKGTEFFGGIFLVLGFLKRPACIFLSIDMIVATFVFHKGLILQNGMTTFLLLICCLTILLSASDKLSIDWLIRKDRKKEPNQ